MTRLDTGTEYIWQPSVAVHVIPALVLGTLWALLTNPETVYGESFGSSAVDRVAAMLSTLIVAVALIAYAWSIRLLGRIAVLLRGLPDDGTAAARMKYVCWCLCPDGTLTQRRNENDKGWNPGRGWGRRDCRACVRRRC